MTLVMMAASGNDKRPFFPHLGKKIASSRKKLTTFVAHQQLSLVSKKIQEQNCFGSLKGFFLFLVMMALFSAFSSLAMRKDRPRKERKKERKRQKRVFEIRKLLSRLIFRGREKKKEILFYTNVRGRKNEKFLLCNSVSGR